MLSTRLRKPLVISIPIGLLLLATVETRGQAGKTCIPPVVCGSSFTCYPATGTCPVTGTAYTAARVSGFSVKRCGGVGPGCGNDSNCYCSFSEQMTGVPGIPCNDTVCTSYSQTPCCP